MKPVESAPVIPANEVRARTTGPLETPVSEEIPAEPETFATAELPHEAEPPVVPMDEPAGEPEAAPAPVYVMKPADADAVRPSAALSTPYSDDGLFHVTVIEEKDVAKRNWLLLGASVLVVVTLMTGIIANLFSQDLDISAINDEISRASLLDIDPMTVEEEKQQKEKDDAGGGGGGGREEKEKASQGDLADQTEKPIRAPDAKVPRLDSPELVLPPPSTQGNKKFEKKYGVWGDPNGQYETLSNGDGSGGGIGSGRGTGQGNGEGTGAGNGRGSGFGNGDGRGNGNSVGDGDEGGPPPPIKTGPTADVKVTFKPKANYTDAARQNQIQGTVTLRVTFLASGGIGGISTVKGLPYGLTENAIAAARSMRFTPAMVNGEPRNVTKQVAYVFSIY